LKLFSEFADGGRLILTLRADEHVIPMDLTPLLKWLRIPDEKSPQSQMVIEYLKRINLVLRMVQLCRCV